MLKRLLSDSLVYGLSGILSRVIGFLLLPLYSRILTPADYGVVSLYNTSFFLMSIILIFGMDSACYRFYYDKAEGASKYSSTANWIWFQWATSALLLSVAFLFGRTIGYGIFKLPEGGRIFMALACTLFLQSLPNIQEVWYRILRKPWGAFSFAILNSAINIAATYYFIVIRREGYWGFIYGQLVSYGIGTLLSLFLLRKNLLPAHINFRLMGNMLKYGAPFVPALALTQAIPWLCNYILSRKVSYDELGLYNIGNTLASILTLATSSFAQAFSPFALSIMDSDDAPRTYARVFIFYVAAISCMCAGYGLFAQEMLTIVTHPKYLGAWVVTIILAYHYFFLSTSTIGLLGASIRKKASPYAYAVLVAAVVCLVLFLALIPAFGKTGAALAILIGQLFIPLLTFYLSQRAFPIPYNFSKASLLVAGSIGVAVTGHFLVPFVTHKPEIWVHILIKLAIFIAYCTAVAYYLMQSSGRKFRISNLRLKSNTNT